MKKGFLLATIFFILFALHVSGQEINIYDRDYVAGETVQSEINYDFFDVSQLSLLDSDDKRIIVSFFSLGISEGNYLAYFNLPASLEQGNYTLQLKDRRVVEGEIIDTLVREELIIGESVSAFTIKPGALKLDSGEDSFKIILKHSAGGNINVNLSVTDDAIKLARESMTLEPGTSKALFADYEYSELESDAKIMLDFGNRGYEIPLMLGEEIIEENITEETTPEENVTGPDTTEDEQKLESAIGILDGIVAIKETAKQDITIEKQIKFVNTYSSPLHNVVFSVNPELQGLVKFNVASFPTVEPNTTYTQNILINWEKGVEAGNYYGEIKIESEEGASHSINLELTFEEVREETEVNETEDEVPDDYVLLNISLNYSEIKETSREERAKNLRIALLMIALVLVFIALLAYRLRPKKKGFKKVGEYASSLKAPPKKKK